MVEPVGCERRNPCCDLERQWMRHLERGDEIELRRLRLDRLDDVPLAVAAIDTPQAGHAVEDARAIRRHVVHAFG